MKLGGLLMAAVLVLVIPACGDSGGSTPADGAMTAMDAAGGDAPGADGGAPDLPPVTSCAGLVPTSQLTGSISADQTWSGVVGVTGEIIVQAAKITISPGTTLVMGADASIQFGWNSNPGSVFARGTAALPIRFCGKEATPGYWSKLLVGDKITSDSAFENVVITDGGKVSDTAVDLNAPILISNVRVQGSAGDGVRAVDFKDGSANLTVTGAAKTAVVLDGQGGITRLPLGGSYTGNGNSVIAVHFDNISLDTTFKNPGVHYLQEISMISTAGAKVTFEAGVDYRMAVDTNLEFGWNSNESTVVANGTAAQPVSIGRASEAAGMWRSLIIGNKVKSDSVLKYVKISGGGNMGPALNVTAPIALQNVTFDGNQTGPNLDGVGLAASSTALTITHTMGAAATVAPNAMVTLPKGGTYTGNTKDWISVAGGTYTAHGTLPNLGVPFRIESAIITSMMSSLTIEAGTTLIMAADAGIEFGWNSNEVTVVAVGTAAAPIVFKGADDVVGSWDGLIIGSAVLGASKMAYVEISNGGKAAGAALHLRKAAFDVTNCKFSKSAGLGIGKTAADATDYTAGGNTFDMNALGNVGAL